MKARFDGVCVKCGQKIFGFQTSPSQTPSDIGWRRRGETYGLDSVAWHTMCMSKPDNMEVIRELQSRKKGRTPEQIPAPVPELPIKIDLNGDLTGEAIRIQVPQPAPKHDMPQDFLSGLSDALVPYLEGKLTANLGEVHTKVDAKLATVDTAIKAIEPQLKAMIDAATRTHIVIERKETGELKDIGRQHKQFKKLCSLINMREHAYLYGPPGWGKSTAAIKYAQACGLNYGFIAMTPQSQDSKVYGFVDALGKQSQTTFYKLWTEGGVMVIEELDNAPNPLLVSLNNALEQRKADFPGVGLIDAHPDFVCIGAGNTNMRGPVPAFPDRRKIDGSVLDRFTFLSWDEDVDFEREITLAINPNAETWVKWVQTVRAMARTEHPALLITPRASYRGARLLASGEFTVEDIAEMALFKDFDKDSKKAIINRHPLPKF